MIAASSYKLACLQPVDNATGMKTVHSQAPRSSLPLPKKHISSEYVRNAAAKRVDCPTSASMAGRAPVPTSKKAALTATVPRYSSFACSGARLRLPLPAPDEQIAYAFPTAASSRNRRNANEVGSILPTSRDFAPCGVRTTTICFSTVYDPLTGRPSTATVISLQSIRQF